MPDRATAGQRPAAMAEEPIVVRQGVGRCRLHRGDSGGGEAGGAIAGQVELPAILPPAGAEVPGIGSVARQHGVAQIGPDLVARLGDAGADGGGDGTSWAPPWKVATGD